MCKQTLHSDNLKNCDGLHQKIWDDACTLKSDDFLSMRVRMRECSKFYHCVSNRQPSDQEIIQTVFKKTTPSANVHSSNGGDR